MKPLYLFKTGTTFAATRQQWGDFDDWTGAPLRAAGIDCVVVDVEGGEALPPLEAGAGVVMTGSHSMVTDNLPWSVTLERWLRGALAVNLPILGICYGHQLLAKAAGGQVGHHPAGVEIGTVTVERLPASGDDPLFQSLPATFSAQVTHWQTVLTLPPGAVVLAANAHEPHQAFRVGSTAYGVQFHPEFSAAVMHAYIDEQRVALQAVGHGVDALRAAVAETPAAAQVLRHFVERVKQLAA